jgi:hypothetical protein
MDDAHYRSFFGPSPLYSRFNFLRMWFAYVAQRRGLGEAHRARTRMKHSRAWAARPVNGLARWWCGVDVGILYITAQWKTPREDYDEYNNKSSLSCETKVY